MENPSQGTWPRASCLWVVSQSTARGMGMELWTLPQCFLRRHVDSFCSSSTPPLSHLVDTHSHPSFALNFVFLFIQAGQCWVSSLVPFSFSVRWRRERSALSHCRGLWASPAPVSSWGGRVEASWARLPFCGTPAWAPATSHPVSLFHLCLLPPASAPYRQAASETPHQ